MSNIPGASQPEQSSSRSPLVLRAARGNESASGLALILGEQGLLATPTQVAEFMRFAAQRTMNLGSMRVAVMNEKILWAIVPFVSPGRTALLFAPNQLVDSRQIDAAIALTRNLLQLLSSQGINLAQVLLDPHHPPVAGLYHEMGFVEMADLIYLSAIHRKPVHSPALPPGASWIRYSAASHDLFARTIQATYQGSLDCPLLNGLRDMDDVIDGHKAAGAFDPELWFLLHDQNIVEGTGLGVVLLTRTGQTEAMEMVYLGLIAAARGKGVGPLLMQQALHATTSDQRRRLTLAVDSRNVPALKLYYSFGLARIGEKIAMMRDLRLPPRLSQPA